MKNFTSQFSEHAIMPVLMRKGENGVLRREAAVRGRFLAIEISWLLWNAAVTGRTPTLKKECSKTTVRSAVNTKRFVKKRSSNSGQRQQA